MGLYAVVVSGAREVGLICCLGDCYGYAFCGEGVFYVFVDLYW